MGQPGTAVTRPLPDPDATRALGQVLGAAVASQAPRSFMLWLRGDLGAGKTELARGVLAGLGHRGRVPSPTYTLVEPYGLAGATVLHVDLYRLRDPAELDDLGLADALAAGAIALVEWPEQAAGRLPAADLEVRLEVSGAGRLARLEPASPVGAAVLAEALARA
ncbi:MAG: tRNA (adenosine(37)-N6)-threonylcarbamoyltransferase complex ATPase subunit type 1 TsaE [Chromatiales bacterium]|jgi:tRNA threonylcarbamoyladenosine biosynthesis protein TsaE|nr:tRNA (adenosine(37)-N6)-threonylcarbamoyltransferase complex ATPase subunit type 1 TsaE [Chromatiales bacterium]